MLFITHHELRPCPGQAVDAARRGERVILFGSRARGDHDADGDWDLCVLVNDDIAPGRYTPGFLWEAVRDLGASIQVCRCAGAYSRPPVATSTRSARHLLLDPPELEDVAFHVHQAVEKAAEAVLWRRAFNIRAAVGPALIPTLRPG